MGIYRIDDAAGYDEVQHNRQIERWVRMAWIASTRMVEQW